MDIFEAETGMSGYVTLSSVVCYQCGYTVPYTVETTATMTNEYYYAERFGRFVRLATLDTPVTCPNCNEGDQYQAALGSEKYPFPILPDAELIVGNSG